MALQEQQLPSVRDGTRAPALWRPAVPAVVVKGAAIIVAGTLTEVLLRRLVRGAVGRASRAVRLPARRRAADVVASGEAGTDGAQVVSDTLLLRRVRIRR